MRKINLRKLTASAGALALAAALGGGMPAAAMADTAPASWISAPTSAKTITATDTLLTTYGVRAGSAGGDYLGISNTNFDFTPGGATATTPYTGYVDMLDDGATKGDGFNDASKARLAIFGSDVNDNPNPYLYNLFYNVSNVTGSTAKQGGTVTYKDGFTPSTTAATTWMNNPNSWGDTAGAASKNVFTGADTIQGKEFGDPSIVYGATSKTCWGNYDPTYTNWYKSDIGNMTDQSVYVHNDSTNVWSQIYTMGQLASVADGKGATRYGKAVDSAVAYEKAIKGNMLYVASKLDSGTAKKKVAYLYAIDGDTSTAYFFTPEASKLTSASNTGKSAVATKAGQTITDTPSADYGANNATVSLGFMDVLPFITDTYNSGSSFKGTIYDADGNETKDASGNAIDASGIAMAVENYVTMSPACTLDFSKASDQLKGVDVIICNTSTALKDNGKGEATSRLGTSGGKNLSNIVNTGDYASGLTAASVEAWAKTLGFTGKVIGGDDFGTSNNQPVPGTAEAVAGGNAPMLYCQRNYTADRDSRAAWAIAQVYPELYNGNADATYGYWVDNIYHVKTASVPAVVQFMENDSTATTYDASTAAAIEANVLDGYKWWTSKGSTSDSWKNYAYYNGSTRASFISGNAADEEPNNTIGIFQPSALWTAAVPQDKPSTPDTPSTPSTPGQPSATTQTITVEKAFTKTFGDAAFDLGAKASGNGALSYEVTSGSDIVSVANGKVTIKKAGKATIRVTAAATGTYGAASADVNITVNKAAQSIKAKAASKTFKVAQLKSAKRSFNIGASLGKGNGKITYKVTDKKSGKVLSVNKKGKVTVKKGTKKGTYKITVSAAATDNYNAAKKTVTVKVK